MIDRIKNFNYSNEICNNSDEAEECFGKFVRTTANVLGRYIFLTEQDGIQLQLANTPEEKLLSKAHRNMSSVLRLVNI